MRLEKAMRESRLVAVPACTLHRLPAHTAGRATVSAAPASHHRLIKQLPEELEVTCPHA